MKGRVLGSKLPMVNENPISGDGRVSDVPGRRDGGRETNKGVGEGSRKTEVNDTRSV